MSLVIIFPIIVGLIYAIPIRQIIPIEIGELLGYYGSAVGILGSFITYRHERKKEKKERNREIRPEFAIDVSKVDQTNNIFLIQLRIWSVPPLRYVYFYDEFISTIVNDRYSFKCIFNKSIEEAKKICDNCYNISHIEVDKNGYPEYIQFVCDDRDGNMWTCNFYRVHDGEKIFYYPRDWELV